MDSIRGDLAPASDPVSGRLHEVMDRWTPMALSASDRPDRSGRSTHRHTSWNASLQCTSCAAAPSMLKGRSLEVRPRAGDETTAHGVPAKRSTVADLRKTHGITHIRQQQHRTNCHDDRTSCRFMSPSQRLAGWNSRTAPGSGRRAIPEQFRWLSASRHPRAARHPRALPPRRALGTLSAKYLRQ